MQALSHFSYHASSGSVVLCDLQGSIYRDGVVLSDPVILSRDRRFGVTDLGSEGISNFFSSYQCNEFCRRDWQLPRDRRAYFRQTMGTSMIEWHAPTRPSRDPVMTGRILETTHEDSYDDDDNDEYPYRLTRALSTGAPLKNLQKIEL
jgi:hypothetical protein